MSNAFSSGEKMDTAGIKSSHNLFETKHGQVPGIQHPPL